MQRGVICAFSWITLFVTFFHIFVSWRKGPAWWTRVAPYLYYGSTILIYQILPLITLAYVMFLWIWPGVSFVESTFSPWNIQYSVFSAAQFITFWTSYRQQL